MIDTINPSLAKQLATRYEILEMLDYQWFVRQANSLFDFLYQKYTIESLNRRYPIRGHHNGRLYETELSFLIENKNGSLVVILSSDVSDVKKVKSEAAAFAMRFSLIQKALTTIFGNKPIIFYVHFPLLGALVVLE